METRRSMARGACKITLAANMDVVFVEDSRRILCEGISPPIS